MPVIPGLGWTFDTVASVYEKLRPGYVDALYEDIFAYCPLDASSHAVEVGIGGGQATEPILKTGCTVTAVEPGVNFCALCREKFRAYPGFGVMNGKFEETSFPPESCDLVYSASAFHWVPEEIGYRKVLDMLKQGGAFARFANHPFKDKGRPGMHEALQEVYAVYMPGSLVPAEYTEDAARSRAKAPVGASVLGRQSTPSISPRPAAIILGMWSFPVATQEARVFTPTSPKLSESGMAPMPKESRTIRKIRFIVSPQKKCRERGIPLPCKGFYLFSMATATSRATFIMVVKEFCRSSAVVSTWVSTWSEMVQMHRPRLP